MTLRSPSIASAATSARLRRYLMFIVVSSLLSAGCSHLPFGSEATAIRMAVESGLANRAVSTGTGDELRALYASPESAALWVDHRGRPNADAEAVLDVLARADADGLKPNDYDASALTQQANQLALERTAEGAAAFELAVSDAVLRYLNDLHYGRVKPKDAGVRLDVRTEERDIASMLRAAVSHHEVTSLSSDLAPTDPFYRDLRQQLERYRDLERRGVPTLADIARRIGPGDAYEDAGQLRTLLTALGDMPAETSAPSSKDARYDDTLVDAVKRFQRRHALPDDGMLTPATLAALRVPLSQRIRQMELSLERLRWLPPMSTERSVAVNVPTFELWAWNGLDHTVKPDLSLAVIVGQPPDNATPIFMEEMHDVVFRPYWNVPESILKNEILPALEKNPAYLSRNDMEIVDGQSDAAKLVAQSDEAITGLEQGVLRVRQRPGPNNSLGLAKFIFPNDANVYIHGTPSQGLFKRARRDLSHGCVRVEDPVALAKWVLADSAWDEQQILDAMNGDQPKTVNVTDPVQVVLLYLTAIVAPGDGSVKFAPDLYKLDAALERALAKRADK